MNKIEPKKLNYSMDFPLGRGWFTGSNKTEKNFSNKQIINHLK